MWRSDTALAVVESGGQYTEDTLRGERHFCGDSMDPCSAVRAVPLSEEDAEVGEDGAARAGDDSSPAVKRDGWNHRSPRTASVARRRRRGSGVEGTRTTTPGSGGERRRGALFSGEGSEWSSDGGQADSQVQGEVAQSLGSADGAFGASLTNAGASGASPVGTGGGSSARVGAPMPATADAVPTGATARGARHRMCAVQRHLDRAEDAGHAVSAKFISCAATLHALGNDLRGCGRAGDAHQVCTAMFELWGAIEALGTFESAHAAAKRASARTPRASPPAEAASEPVWPFAPDRAHAPEQAACDDCAEGMPEWLAQAALLVAADTDAAVSGVTTMADVRTTAPGAATASAPTPVVGRRARRRRCCAAIRLQAGVRATIARRRAESIRATERSAARAAEVEAACAAEAEAARAAEAEAEARAAEAEAADGLGRHWAAVAEAQRQLASQLRIDPLSLMSQVEYNLAATRARWAAARAAEAGHQARVAQATEPPTATDAPT